MKNSVWKKYLFLLAALLGILVAGSFAILLIFHPTTVANGFHNFINILMPFIYGIVITYLIHPLSDFIEVRLKKLNQKIGKKEHPGLIRMCAIFASFVLIFLIIVLLIGMVLPQIITSISGILSQLPAVVKDFQDWIVTLERGDISHELITYIEQITATLSERLQKFLSTDLLPNMQAVITEITSSFFNLITLLKNFGIGCIVSIYILSSREKFLAQGKLLIYSLLPGKWADWLVEEIHYADRMFSGFITGKLLDSTIIGIICFVFCWIAKMPYAMLVSIIVGITNMIPFFGPYLGAIPSAILILMVNPYQCVVFIIFIIILQQIDGNVIGPRILGDKLGLSGFWVLFAILFFGSLWGLVGMLIGVPLFAIIYNLLQKLVGVCLKKRNQEKLLADYEKRFSQKPGN